MLCQNILSIIYQEWDIANNSNTTIQGLHIVKRTLVYLAKRSDTLLRFFFFLGAVLEECHNQVLLPPYWQSTCSWRLWIFSRNAACNLHLIGHTQQEKLGLGRHLFNAILSLIESTMQFCICNLKFHTFRGYLA